MARKYLGFPLDDEIENQITTLIEEVKKAGDKRPYAKQIYELIKKLSDTGLDYFFVKPLEDIGMGMFKVKAVQMALSAGKRGIMTVGKGIILGMNNEQLLTVINLMESSLTIRAEEAADSIKEV